MKTWENLVMVTVIMTPLKMLMHEEAQIMIHVAEGKFGSKFNTVKKKNMAILPTNRPTLHLPLSQKAVRSDEI